MSYHIELPTESHSWVAITYNTGTDILVFATLSAAEDYAQGVWQHYRIVES
jgi:hypothetical protein